MQRFAGTSVQSLNTQRTLDTMLWWNIYADAAICECRGLTRNKGLEGNDKALKTLKMRKQRKSISYCYKLWSGKDISERQNLNRLKKSKNVYPLYCNVYLLYMHTTSLEMFVIIQNCESITIIFGILLIYDIRIWIRIQIFMIFSTMLFYYILFLYPKYLYNNITKILN